MRRILLLCLISPLAWAEKDPLIDFDSPFNKTAILLDALGKTETREVLEAQKKDNLLELRKADGTLVVIPEDKVVAVLPKLPSPGLRYTQAQAAQALIFLQKAQSKISNREEVSPAVMLTWQKLSKEESNYESEAKKAKTSMIQNWFSKVALEGDEEKNISLDEYIREGEGFLSQAGEDRPAVESRLEKARQRMAMDFSKVDKIRLSPEWGSINPLAPLGMVGVLALVAVWGVLNVSNFLTALKMTLMSLLSSERTSRVIILNTKSLFGLFLGPLLLYGVYQATRVEKSVPIIDAPSLTLTEKRALYLSLNSHFNWSRQAAQQIEVSSGNVLRFLFAKIENTNPEAGYVQYATPVFQFGSGGLSLCQKLKVLWLPLQLKFDLMIGDGPFSFAQVKTNQFWLGKVPLGSLIGDYVAEGLYSAFRLWNDELGIETKALWSWKDRNQFLITIPEVFVKKTGDVISEGNNKKKITVPKRASATALAEAFASGDGDAYLGKYIDVFGAIDEVSSVHRLGNNLAGETVRKIVMQNGGPEAAAKLAAKGLEDTPDSFFLTVEGSPAAAKIRVKCLVKAPEIFFLDSHGDLYKEGQNPANTDPLVRKGTAANFTGGRIESFARGVIEIYDAKFMESGSEPAH